MNDFKIPLELNVKVKHDEIVSKTIVGLSWPGFNIQGIKINGLYKRFLIEKAIKKLIAEDKLNKANQLLQEYVEQVHSV